MKPEFFVRNETDADVNAITAVTVAAFKTLEISNHTEQFIIEALRAARALTVSLVAEMADLKIRVFKGGDSAPETTVTIPGSVLKIASKLIPKQATTALQEKGIDLDEILKLSENPDARGTLVDIEEHKKNERVVIALE